MEKNWAGLPFKPISEFYKENFGEKVYKIPVAVSGDCPNRRGLKGMKTCSFCDVWGSAARSEALEMDLISQIEKYRAQIGQQYNSRKFLIYFQSYTTTFQGLSKLRDYFAKSLASEQIVGLVIGTRPDCLSPALFEILNDLTEKTFVSVEMGVQSFDNETLEFYRRGHSAEDSIQAILALAKIPKLDLSAHFIFGAPNDNLASAQKTAEICNSLPIHSVKLHNLHVLKNTYLEELWNLGEFKPVEFLDYAELIRVFLEHLNPTTSVHRLAAYASRWEELLAPSWTADRMKTHQGLVDHLRRQASVQSLLFKPDKVHETSAQQKIFERRYPKSGVNFFVPNAP